MAKYCELAVTFLKVGTFTIGGGYAMIPLMEREVVERRGWMDEGDFWDVVAVSQSMPGVFAVNMAAVTGFRLRGVWGSVCAIVGNVAVPVAVILALAMLFRQVREVPLVERLFMGLRPAVVGLMAVPVVTLARSARLTWRNCWLPLGVVLAVAVAGISPALMVLAAVGLGIICAFWKGSGR